MGEPASGALHLYLTLPAEKFEWMLQKMHRTWRQVPSFPVHNRRSLCRSARGEKKRTRWSQILKEAVRAIRPAAGVRSWAAGVRGARLEKNRRRGGPAPCLGGGGTACPCAWPGRRARTPGADVSAFHRQEGGTTAGDNPCQETAPAVTLGRRILRRNCRLWQTSALAMYEWGRVEAPQCRRRGEKSCGAVPGRPSRALDTSRDISARSA